MREPLVTKNKMLKMLSEKKMTLTDLCRALDLAPSTMNQHINELLEMHAIRQVDSAYARKWKYYELDPSFKGFEAERYPAQSSRIMLNSPYKFMGIIALLLLAALAVWGIYANGPQGTPAQPYISAGQYLAPGNTVAAGTTVFSISDAPTTPQLDDLNITISSLLVHSTDGKWYVVFNGTKTVDLVELDNISEVVSGANIPAGTYDTLRLDVVNASAVLNGNATSVFVPTQTIDIYGLFNITNGSANWINLDVNLSASIHITSNDTIVLLPVVTFEKLHGGPQSFSIGAYGILNCSNFSLDFQKRVHMTLNGSEQAGPLPLPSYYELEISRNGIAVLNGTYAVPPMIMFHARPRPFMMNNTTVAQPIGGPAGPPHIIMPPRNTSANATVDAWRVNATANLRHRA